MPHSGIVHTAFAAERLPAGTRHPTDSNEQPDHKRPSSERRGSAAFTRVSPTVNRAANCVLRGNCAGTHSQHGTAKNCSVPNTARHWSREASVSRIIAESF